MKQYRRINGSLIAKTPEEWEAYDAANFVPTKADLIAERDRRIQLPIDYDFGDARGVHTFSLTPKDQKDWDRLNKHADSSVKRGKGNKVINIVTETGPTQITADEWFGILEAIGDRGQALYEKYFAIKAMNPIPSDYTDDSYWT